MKIYITNSYRDGHTHTIGISYDYNRATLYGKAHHYFRGGKYYHKTFSQEIDEKVKKVYYVYMWDNIDKFDDFKKDDNYLIEVFSSKSKAILRFNELKILNIRDNIKLSEQNVDSSTFSKSEIEFFHSGWIFFNNKEKEVLRDMYASFLSKM